MHFIYKKIGDFKEDKFDGNGEFRWPNGIIYNGNKKL